ncbi:MAG: tetratricopeptide repeat protein [Sulfuricellaceae bacterium]
MGDSIQSEFRAKSMKKSRKNTKAKPRPISAPFHALLQQAQRLFAQGRHRQALLIVQDCLTLAPQNADLLDFAGVCAISLDDREGAEQFWRRAIALDRATPETYFNLGLLLAKRQQQEEAEHCYRRAISLNPDNAQAYCNLGNLLNDGAEAEACYCTAIALDPQFEAAHYNLGNRLVQRGAWEEAEQCYRQALVANPADAPTHAKLGLVLAQRGRPVEAERSYRRAIAFDPECAEAHANLGLLLEDSRRLDEAEQCLRLALALSPDSTEMLSNLGNLLAQSGRTDEAEKCHRQAILRDPTSASAYCNLGVLLATRRRDDIEAEQCFRQALACNPQHAPTQFNLGHLLLAAGRLEEGWAYYEARNAQGIATLPAICTAQWQGEPLAGKSLLVLSEQGYGDAIQFCRYLPQLKAQGTAHLTLKCRPELTALLATLAGVDSLTDSAEQDIPAHDYWVFLHSIPFHSKTTLHNIPARTPYLHALPERLARWSARLPTEGLRVGLVWKGDRMHRNDAQRSLAGLAVLRPLWLAPGVCFVSVQKGQGEDEAAQHAADQPLLDLGGEVADFADTAAIVECLDLVICVDTAIAHLAGALGKPCWVMLPAYKTDWRWLRERNDTPWYPHMRLFRQTAPDDWASVVAEIARALNDFRF